jgi:protease PrsW
MNLLLLALAPVIVIALFVYFRDKYEKEPVKLLIFSLLLGAITVVPAILAELFIAKYAINFEGFAHAGYESFIGAALPEELFKYLAFIILIWRNKNFNEKFDGIVYAVFISLGFAALENVLYVYGKGAGTGLLRAFTAVPGHALFGVAMGFHFAIAKFEPEKRVKQLLWAFTIPFILHGFYDFILFSQNIILLLIFIPYIVFMWILGFKRMKKHSDDSIFKSQHIDKLISLNNPEDNNISSPNDIIDLNSTSGEQPKF